MSRMLASTRKILQIQPIEDADAVELVTVDGWNVVVRKDSFAVGDIVLYFEVDSWVPADIAPFLSNPDNPKMFNGVVGNRLKTKRIRGVVSQGLIIQVHDLFNFRITQEYIDLTDVLGVQKWEKALPESLAGTAKGNFPSFIPKTNEERIQNCKREFNTGVIDGEFSVTEKLDGTSFTCFINDGEVGVCSRNLELKRSEGSTYWNIFDKYNLEAILRNCGANIAIQGEIIGTGIQGNHYKLSDTELRIFKIYSIDENRYFTHDEFINFRNSNDLISVPCLGVTTIDPFVDTIATILANADGKSSLNDCLREGLVYTHTSRPEVHFKAISNDWLLRYE